MTIRPISLAFLSVLFLVGCAQIPPDAGQNPEDPYERFNRHVHAFNSSLDRVVLKPVTESYRWAVPETAREGVSNVVDNIGEPGNAVNNVLQGKVTQGIESVFRFMVNTTFGIGGIFDVASWIGMEKTNEDFGQTLGVWGMNDGPYLVLPVLGPSGARDVFRWPVSAATNPLTYGLWHEEWYWGVGVGAVTAVDARSRLIDAGFEDLRTNVVDEYVALRTAYRQMRKNQVADGELSSDEALENLTPLSFDEDDESAPEAEK